MDQLRFRHEIVDVLSQCGEGLAGARIGFIAEIAGEDFGDVVSGDGTHGVFLV